MKNKLNKIHLKNKIINNKYKDIKLQKQIKLQT